MSNEVRVRFAPSPTGHLHIGGARTALFNWLFARHHEGVFILRIEDTDRSRSTDEYIEAIVEGMRWLGLDWDEGPYRQTDRFDVYRSFVDRLLEVGAAYRCYCTPEDLEQRRQAALSQGANPRYDGRCREIRGTRNAPFAVRFAMPVEGQTVVKDLIRGTVVFDNEQLDDMVILRSDGTPTYNFVVVVDDIDMRISHVIRGDDHLNNTPKQIHIYKALGGRAPEFAHLPMILGADKTRLSKRHGATSVNAYREMGYLPDALVNYLARLGWSHGDQEVFSREELIRYFSLEHVGKSAAVFNPDKLLWLNGQYMSRCSPGELAVKVLPFLVERKIVDSGRLPDMAWLAKAVNSLKERAKTLVELAESMRFYVADDVEIDAKAAEKFLRPESLAHISALVPRLEAMKDFTAAAVEKVFHELAEDRGIKLGALAQPVRVALTGGTASPGLFEVIEIIGRDRVLKRLRKALGEA